ncbi:hypothetical protein D3C80_1049540 [compost metagenome]
MVGEDEVNTTEPPAQNVVTPFAVIVGTAGMVFTITLIGAEAGDVHPNTVCVTVYEPLALTVIEEVVSEVDQVFPVEIDEVNTTEPPAQKVVGPPAVITGAAGIGFTVMV